MGQDLHWEIRPKNGGDESVIVGYEELSNDPFYDVLHNPRKVLDTLFGYRVTDDRDEEAIFTNVPNPNDNFDFLTLKELIEKLEDKRFYEARKKFIDEETKDSGRYEKIIEAVKSFEKFGLSEEINIGLGIY